MNVRIFQPKHVLAWTTTIIRWMMPMGWLLILVGSLWGLLFAPDDYQQMDAVKIMYVHVPSAWMALFFYGMMAVFSGLYLVARLPMADTIAQGMAPIGAMYTLICLITGSLWGKPIWGTWWAWDARLTSVLILFFLYMGYIGLRRSYGHDPKGATMGAIMAIIGAINLPIIKFSVDWWHTLHQPASIMKLGAPTIHRTMMMPLLPMALGFLSLGLAIASMAIHHHIMTRGGRR